MHPPTDVYELLHWNMMNAHSVFKLGHKSIVERLEDPPVDDLYNFLGYCETWALATKGYHYTQDKVTYPLLTQRMTFTGVDEHFKLVNSSIPEILATIEVAKADHSKFDAGAMKSQLVAFGDSLFPKLDVEASQMTAQALNAAGFSEHDMKDLINGLRTCRESTADPFVMVPFVVSHVPPEMKPHWPEFPWLLRVLFIPYLFSLRHPGYWKYSPYGTS